MRSTRRANTCSNTCWNKRSTWRRTTDGTDGTDIERQVVTSRNRHRLPIQPTPRNDRNRWRSRVIAATIIAAFGGLALAGCGSDDYGNSGYGLSAVTVQTPRGPVVCVMIIQHAIDCDWPNR